MLKIGWGDITFGLFPRKAEILKFFLAKLEQSIEISNGLTSTIKRQPQDVWWLPLKQIPTVSISVMVTVRIV